MTDTSIRVPNSAISASVTSATERRSTIAVTGAAARADPVTALSVVLMESVVTPVSLHGSRTSESPRVWSGFANHTGEVKDSDCHARTKR